MDSLPEPYAEKFARTVLRGGKPGRAYLSQLGQQVDGWCM